MRKFDTRVLPGSRIDRLPRALRGPALVYRHLKPRPRPRYAYRADGLATVHHSPFEADREFTRLYEEMERDWYVHERPDVRWRMWLLTRFARMARELEGNAAEFGTYRAGCAFMLLGTGSLPPAATLHLFDTFAGAPGANLTGNEIGRCFEGRHDDTSPEYVARRLERWADRIAIHPGDVFDTLPATDTGPLAFAHMDLNASAATRHALEYAYARLVPRGVIVFDDYGDPEYGDQRAAIDDFLAPLPEETIALPTGQALLVRAGGLAD